MRKLDHDQKRLEIAEAAARIIARSGMEGLTTRNLANAIHGSIGAVHHYFNSKDEIVLAAFDWANQSVIARLQKYLEHGASFDDMLRVIEAALPHDAQTRIEWRVRLALWNHAATNSDAGKLLRANIRTHRNALAEVARALQAAGEMRADLDADSVAQMFLELAYGMGFAALLGLQHSRYDALRVCKMIIDDLRLEPARTVRGKKASSGRGSS